MLKVKIYNLAHKEVGEIDLESKIFGLNLRQDLIKKVIDWQLAKRRSGAHSVKTISDISGTTKKPFKQKGTGNARQGSLRSAQMRGGAQAHGPVLRSHSYSVTKKVRKLALCHALSARSAGGMLYIIDSFDIKSHKTKDLFSTISSFGCGKIFMVDSIVPDNLKLASRNINNINVVPFEGINVYDIIKNDKLLITKACVKLLEKRLING